MRNSCLIESYLESTKLRSVLAVQPYSTEDVFEELMDDDSAFFEEPVAAIVERMASLSLGRDE